MKTRNNKTYQVLIFQIIVALIISPTLFSCSRKHNAQLEDLSSQMLVVITVKAKQLNLDKEMDLPGQLEAYQNVPVHAKVEGFISSINVDRGSVIKKGQTMIEISCPELEEKVKEGAAKLSATQSSYRQSQSALENEIAKELEAKAKLQADSLTYSRLKEAAKTAGAIAQNEVDIAQQSVEADTARVNAAHASIEAARALVSAEAQNIIAAKNVLRALEDMKSYLTIKAPFDGVITERNVHEGSIVAVDPLRNSPPLVRIQEKDLLRLVVAVPEDCTSGLAKGVKLAFTVPAYVGKTFYGIVARLGYALDTKTRTMPVELDVHNITGELEPGMFATVKWRVLRPYKTIFLPASAVANDFKSTFVLRVNANTIERITVKRGLSMNGLVEVIGDIKPGDEVILKATDEFKTGSKVKCQLTENIDINDTNENHASGE